jgi:signal transduction histidine kinase
VIGFGIVSFILYYYKKRSEHLYEKETMSNEFQQELLKTKLEAQEETFMQIAEELHDNVGQLLSSTKLLLGITERMLTEVPETLVVASETLGKAIRDIRSLSKVLNKEWLEQFSFIQNLKTETDRINLSRVIDVGFDATVNTLPLKAETQLMLFRIVQEALNNSIKHSDAKKIDLTLRCSSENIEVTIFDDGRGFDMNAVESGGFGLGNMRHRTKLLKGSIEWNSMREKGTFVRIFIPIEH